MSRFIIDTHVWRWSTITPLRVAGLPEHHRDPFDRLLIAQSQALGIPVVTADEQFIPYDIEVLMARA